MHSHFTPFVAQEHIADLRRAADRERLARAARGDRRDEGSAPIRIARRRQRRLGRALAWARRSATTSA
jgi:hypothetical protein